jgi:hypothetical protein
MTSWGIVILVSALVVGLAPERSRAHRLHVALAIVVVVIIFTGLRQHTL